MTSHHRAEIDSSAGSGPANRVRPTLHERISGGWVPEGEGSLTLAAGERKEEKGPRNEARRIQGVPLARPWVTAFISPMPSKMTQVIVT